MGGAGLRAPAVHPWNKQASMCLFSETRAEASKQHESNRILLDRSGKDMHCWERQFSQKLIFAQKRIMDLHVFVFENY